MCNPRNLSGRYQSGQALVEFSIIAASVLMLIFALINCALAVYQYNFVSFAAREATRYAAVRGSTSGSPASTTDITNFVDAEANGLNTSKLTVSTTWIPDNKPGSAVQIQVTYPFSFAIPFLNLISVNLTSTSQLVIMQ
jgi:Flp pilus assembly protein TadG